jgi:hypothetical protein
MTSRHHLVASHAAPETWFLVKLSYRLKDPRLAKHVQAEPQMPWEGRVTKAPMGATSRCAAVDVPARLLLAGGAAGEVADAAACVDAI